MPLAAIAEKAGYVPYRRKFSHWQNFLSMNFLSRVNDYIEDMATLTALAKTYSIEYFCNKRCPGLAKFLPSKNLHLYGTLFGFTTIVVANEGLEIARG